MQLYDDDLVERNALRTPTDRARQLRILLDAYGLARSERSSFVDKIAEFAIHSAREEAVLAGITSETAVAVDESGYPVLWAVTWRVRSASWILRHRSLLESTIL